MTTSNLRTRFQSDTSRIGLSSRANASSARALDSQLEDQDEQAYLHSSHDDGYRHNNPTGRDKWSSKHSWP